MTEGIGDKGKGKFEELKDKAKETLGKVTGDRDTEDERRDQAVHDEAAQKRAEASEVLKRTEAGDMQKQAEARDLANPGPTTRE